MNCSIHIQFKKTRKRKKRKGIVNVRVVQNIISTINTGEHLISKNPCSCAAWLLLNLKSNSITILLKLSVPI